MSHKKILAKAKPLHETNPKLGLTIEKLISELTNAIAVKKSSTFKSGGKAQKFLVKWGKNNWSDRINRQGDKETILGELKKLIIDQAKKTPDYDGQRKNQKLLIYLALRNKIEAESVGGSSFKSLTIDQDWLNARSNPAVCTRTMNPVFSDSDSDSDVSDGENDQDDIDAVRQALRHPSICGAPRPSVIPILQDISNLKDISESKTIIDKIASESHPEKYYINLLVKMLELDPSIVLSFDLDGSAWGKIDSVEGLKCANVQLSAESELTYFNVYQLGIGKIIGEKQATNADYVKFARAVKEQYAEEIAEQGDSIFSIAIQELLIQLADKRLQDRFWTNTSNAKPIVMAMVEGDPMKQYYLRDGETIGKCITPTSSTINDIDVRKKNVHSIESRRLKVVHVDDKVKHVSQFDVQVPTRRGDDGLLHGLGIGYEQIRQIIEKIVVQCS